MIVISGQNEQIWDICRGTTAGIYTFVLLLSIVAFAGSQFTIPGFFNTKHIVLACISVLCITKIIYLS